MGDYAGESLAKKVARVRTYLRAKEMLAAAGKTDNVTALVLAGPASEVGCLKHILRPTNLVVVDRDQTCVDRFFDKVEKNYWDELKNESGVTSDLSKVEPRECIDFANLDLMGNINGNPGAEATLIARRLDMWSIIAVTYLRGRETGTYRQFLKDYRSGVIGLASQGLRERKEIRRRWGPDSARAKVIFGSFNNAINARLLEDYIRSGKRPDLEDLLKDPEELKYQAVLFGMQLKANKGVHLTPIGSHTYRADVSPMGVVMLQLICEKEEKALWVKHLDGKISLQRSKERRLINSAIRKDPMEELLKEADYLEEDGYSKEAVADIFDVSVGTMAAWKAHRTMGTYAA